MTRSMRVQDERLAVLPRREEMATLNIGQLDVIGWAPGGTAVVSVTIIDVQAQSANFFICLSGC